MRAEDNYSEWQKKDHQYTSIFICRYGGYTFDDEAVGGASDQVKATVWYNNKGYHSLPSFYSGLSNGILRSRVEAMNNDPTQYGRYP